jgi:hypothetical protein
MPLVAIDGVEESPAFENLQLVKEMVPSDD